MRILLLTRSYPRDGDLYQYPFVHRRVLAYMAAGHSVRVVRLSDHRETYAFERVDCHLVPPGDFAEQALSWQPDVIAVHGLDEHIWPAVATLTGRWPVCAWLHGSEIPAFFRDKALRISDDRLRQIELRKVEDRLGFWRGVFHCWPNELSLALVSNYSLELMHEDLGAPPQHDRIAIIPNPIETDLFRYEPKAASDRFRILSIRPYASPSYGNDLAVGTVLSLSSHPLFAQSHFTFIGDGPMFDEVLAPLRSFDNVTIRREFLRQDEIAALHRNHGIFLVPTRLDTQGVSRDEAMASGLVPVTNAVCSIPEFVDEGCAILAGPDDSDGLAQGLARLFDDPELFLAMSANAARRVRKQSGNDIIIPRELKWMEDRVHVRR